MDERDRCVNCELKPARSAWARECDACARYRQRTGRNRPQHVIDRQLEREQRQQANGRG